MKCYRCGSNRMIPAYCQTCTHVEQTYNGHPEVRLAVMRAFHKRICSNQAVCECQPFVDLAVPAENESLAEATS